MNDLEVLAISVDAGALASVPLRPLIDLLLERLALYMRDRVWLVRLSWGAVLPAPPHPPTAARFDPFSAPADALRNFVDAFAAAWGKGCDLLLLDPSDLYGGPLSADDVNLVLVDALRTVDPPARISHVITDPAQWQGLPFPLPTQGVELLPTVLLPDGPPGNVPGASWIALFDQLSTANIPTVGATFGALVDLVQGVTKFYVDGGGSVAGDPSKAWPLDAVKLRPPAELTNALSLAGPPYLLDDLALAPDVRDRSRRVLERWARAVTARRVGLALGGGGAHSYVCVGFIEEMSARKIPLDIVAGTSFGSIVAGYYAVLGDAGLTAVVRHWYWAQLTVLLGWITTDPLQMWVDFDLGFRDINDLEVSFVPVAANAYTGHAWHLRIGAVGHTCAASGSLPPLSPTYDGNVRLLDGALTAGVPASAVGQAGAGLVAGANVVPYPPALIPDPALPLPQVWSVLRSLNPLRRLLDFSRGYQMLVRQGAHSQDTFADVVYPADTQGIDGTAFYASQAIVDQARASTPLTIAIGQLEDRWRDLLRHPAGRVRYWYTGDRVFLAGDIAPGGAKADDFEAIDAIEFVGLTDVLSPGAQTYLARIADFLNAVPWPQVVIRLAEPDPTPNLGVQRRQAVRDVLTTAGVAVARLGDDLRHGPGIAAPRVELEIWLQAGPLPSGGVTLIP